MADLSLTNSIDNGTSLDADEVQQSLDEIVSDINANCARIDGSNAMTSALSLSGDPSADAHAVRKAYVDGAYVFAQSSIAQAFTANAHAVLKFSTETYDTATAYNLSSGFFTAPKTGIYAVTFAVAPDQADTYLLRMRIVADSVNYEGPRYVPSAINNVNESAIQVHHAEVRCASGATINPDVSISSALTRSLGAYLTITWLHG